MTMNKYLFVLVLLITTNAISGTTTITSPSGGGDTCAGWVQLQYIVGINKKEKGERLKLSKIGNNDMHVEGVWISHDNNIVPYSLGKQQNTFLTLNYQPYVTQNSGVLELRGECTIKGVSNNGVELYAENTGVLYVNAKRGFGGDIRVVADDHSIQHAWVYLEKGNSNPGVTSTIEYPEQCTITKETDGCIVKVRGSADVSVLNNIAYGKVNERTEGEYRIFEYKLSASEWGTLPAGSVTGTLNVIASQK
ncbi:hypothetical protein [Yersinia enterocolitica]|uniref:hypothetical protein n=1 Tax=Yersinia enterocolitica TaxID=630 RepID=UPI003F4657CA